MFKNVFLQSDLTEENVIPITDFREFARADQAVTLANQARGVEDQMMTASRKKRIAPLVQTIAAFGACCRVLWGVVGCCRVLQGVAGCCKVLQGTPGCCRMLLQCVAECAECCRVLQCVASLVQTIATFGACCRVLRGAIGCCRVLQGVAGCGRALLQCVSECCSVLLFSFRLLRQLVCVTH